MAALLAKKAGRGECKHSLASIEPSDPLYEDVDVGGKKKRVRRTLPEGLSKRDRKVLQKIKSRAHYLDKGMNLCGLRVGWTFWIGIIPGAGDVVNAILNYLLVIRLAKRAEIPGWLLHQMLLNNAVSAGVGVVPLVGDLVVAVYKANSRNAHLLEEYLAVRGQEYLASQGATLPTNSVAGVQPGITQGEPNLQSEYKPGAGMVAGEIIPMPGQQPARGGSGRGWFGGFGGGGGAQQQQQQPVQAPVQAHGAGAGAGYGATSGQVRRA
ncbi:hypothetical protein FFLO_01385 [Filobasidium floriforme]|uniref:Uncharacterized protein n=1 Tax=Filobasidium floriforme TaxID=5210 RepID=A0A8K0JRK3_9TREE|nr:hypothetical protein FFLO_01385 [Filobasidium floriforme]